MSQASQLPENLRLPYDAYDDVESCDEMNASCGGATSFPFLCYEQRECFGFL